MAKKKPTKPAARSKQVPAIKKAVTRAVKKPAAAPEPKAVAKRKAAPSAATSSASLPLGRPKVTADEKLYLLFKEDYHARQIFEFLRAETVRELEQFSPQQIVKLLSQPIQSTVDRIRQRLAEKNRHLRDDLEFASQRQEAKGVP